MGCGLWRRVLVSRTGAVKAPFRPRALNTLAGPDTTTHAAAATSTAGGWRTPWVLGVASAAAMGGFYCGSADERSKQLVRGVAEACVAPGVWARPLERSYAGLCAPHASTGAAAVEATRSVLVAHPPAHGLNVPSAGSLSVPTDAPSSSPPSPRRRRSFAW